MCLPQGIPEQIHSWYQLAMSVEVDIVEYKRHRGTEGYRKKSQEKRPLGQKLPITLAPAPAETPRHTPGPCFLCGQEGHQIAVCLAPAPMATLENPGPSKLKLPKKGKEKLRVAARSLRSPSPQVAKGRKL